MKISELFRYALLDTLKQHGLTEKKLAEDLQISPVLVNDYLKGRKNFQRIGCSVISEYFGLTLFEMLSLGYQLTTGSKPMPPKVPMDIQEVVRRLEDLSQDDLKIIDDLARRLSGK